MPISTKILLTMLCLGSFELYSRWVPLNSLKIRDSSRVSRPRSSANKLKPNLFAIVLIFNALHCIFFIKPVNIQSIMSICEKDS